MNPLLLLLGILSASSLGSLSKSASFTGGRSDDDGDTRSDDVTPPPPPIADDPEEPEDPPVVVDPDPEEPPVVVNPDPEAPEQPGDGGNGGDDTTPTIIADGTVEVMGGRVTTLSAAGDDITDIKIVSGVEFGTVTANPDGTFALVMTLSDFSGSQSFTYEATHEDGSVTTHEVGLNVTPGVLDNGWGTGSSHYMLETDADDRVVVEHGEVHTKVYISGSDTALSRADIAAMEGISIDQVTGAWLVQNTTYGQSEDLALDSDLGHELWQEVTPPGAVTSNWMLLERGYEYDFGELSQDNRLLYEDTWGESKLHPMYIGAFGEGTLPEITSQFLQFQESSHNLVVQDIHFSGGIKILDGSNIIFDHVKVTEDGVALQYMEGITFRNSSIYDVVTDLTETWEGDTYWTAHHHRTSGLFAEKIDGLLLENLFVDHNGWADDYRLDLSFEGGQPPSMYSQNLYINFDVNDLTLRDTISMRAASFGVQLRPGGFVEDLLLLDNNAGMNIHDGTGDWGNYTLVTDMVITSAGHRYSTEQIGAMSYGLEVDAPLVSLVDNIIAHMADPDSPEEIAEKTANDPAYVIVNDDPLFDDTIIWNWHEPHGHDSNTDGLDTNVLDQTTIQNFTRQLLGDPNATISDLADYLRSRSEEGALDGVVDADLIIRFFQEGFGIAPDGRLEATTLRFVPDETGDGVRWDNRMNWDTDDLPGTLAGDSVDLAGNHVVYGGTNTIDTLDFGDGGQLDFYHGKLTTTGGMQSETTGYVSIEEVGQLWTDGTTGEGDLAIGVGGGRFANTGQMDDTDLLANGGQTILATGGAEYEVSASKTLAVFAEAAKVGFDGDDGGIAILDMQQGSTLSYAATDGGLGTIEEFRSGAFGDAPNVQSGIDLGNATLEIDLSGLNADTGSAFTLMDSDELVGIFESANVGGLGGRDATIVVDYINDSVTLQLTSGTGQVSVETLGDESDREADEDALWLALTADQGFAEDAEIAFDEDEEEEVMAA